MNMGGIIKNSLKYPFTDWKKILIFGFIILISNLSTLYIVDVFFKSYVVLLDLIRVLISFFTLLGYLFRIIKSSLNNMVNFQNIMHGGLCSKTVSGFT